LILYGGGHVDYGGNEFYAIQLDGNPAYALRLSDPSPCSNCACNASRSLGATSDDGSPRSNHTYDTMVYVPPEDKLIKIGITATYCSSGGDQHIWMLPLASLSGAGHTLGSPPWAKFSAGPFANSSPGAGTGDFDRNTGLVFFSNANIYPGFYAFNPSSTTTISNVPPGSVIQINGTSAGCYDCTSVVDPLERRLFQFGDSSIPSPFQSWGIDLKNKSTYGQPVRLGTPTSCPKLPNAPGADWDPVAQVFVIWPSNGNPATTQLYAFNPSASNRAYGAVTVPPMACAALNPPGSGPPNAPTGNGTFKRFRYVGYCDCFVLLNAWGQNAFIVRTR
jgi:hypothetical protein